MSAMVLHSCKNCGIIEEVLGKQTEWFDRISAENMTLQFSLLKYKAEVETLQHQVSDLNLSLVQERDRSFKMYLEKNMNQDTDQTRSNFSVKMPSSTCLLNQKTSRDVVVQLTPSTSKQQLINIYQAMCDEQVRTILNKKDLLVSEHKKSTENWWKHCGTLLGTMHVYRQELFKQKKINIQEHKKFLETVEAIRTENKTYLQHQQKFVEIEKYKKLQTSHNNELKQRDIVVQTLRRQYVQLESKIVELEKQEKLLKKDCEEKVMQLRTLLKRVRDRYDTLENRRILDREGFYTDVVNLRKEVKTIKYKHGNNSSMRNEIECVLDNLQHLEKRIKT